MLFEKLIQANEKINDAYMRKNKGYTVALVGNPNVGKSTVFNGLTGMKQHTGNWPGKTVELASGHYIHGQRIHEMIDLPGTYSLLAHSSEEEVTRNYICFEHCDVCIVVCDATCLERNLNLVLQTLEITQKVVVVLNLCDEADKKNIVVDEKRLAQMLQVPVVKMSARNAQGFDALKAAVEEVAEKNSCSLEYPIVYPAALETAIKHISDVIHCHRCNRRFLAMKLLEGGEVNQRFYEEIHNQADVKLVVEEESQRLKDMGVYAKYEEMIVAAIHARANIISEQCITFNNHAYLEKDMRIDRVLTHPVYGVLCMLLLLAIIFWITISAANVPSALLSSWFTQFEAWLHQIFLTYDVHPFITGLVIDGMIKTCGWVIAVMLPPMAVFFPLFTLLEDFGYLPRVAFNLDGFFQKAHTCGKQALTICMGFGCNAVGVSGARIIDSPRERLIAMITNVFVPCNGRFPTLISIITMFFAGMFLAPWDGIISTLLLTGIIVFGIIVTLCISSILSKTLLKGIPSSFSLELPPYRKPQIGKVIVRSMLDRTLFVLGRAISAAIPAGALIWLLANVYVNDSSLLAHIAGILDPFGQIMGLDGVILLAFILGFPANEIVVPIMIMTYMATGSILDISDLHVLKALFVSNGWTWVTAICTLLFSLVHFPCATTLLTIRKETKSWKWTWISFLIPTIAGVLLCMTVNLITALWM